MKLHFFEHIIHFTESISILPNKCISIKDTIQITELWRTAISPSPRIIISSKYAIMISTASTMVFLRGQAWQVRLQKIWQRWKTMFGPYTKYTCKLPFRTPLLHQPQKMHSSLFPSSSSITSSSPSTLKFIATNIQRLAMSASNGNNLHKSRHNAALF